MFKIFLFVNLINLINCADILAIFPTTSHSHQIVFRLLVKDLLTRGHSVTVLTPNIYGKYENLNVTEINIEVETKTHGKFNDFYYMYKENIVYQSNIWKANLNEDQLKLTQVQQLISDAYNGRKFDLVIFEYFAFFAHMAFAEIYDCPIVGIVSMDAYSYVHESFGNSANPMINPDIVLPYSSGELSFFQRIRSLIFYSSVKFILQPLMELKYNYLINKYFPNVTKSLSEIKERVQILMINTNPVIKNRPLAANTIQLGFLHVEPPKNLTDKKLINFLDNSVNGVIYMSFGSNVQSSKLNRKIIETFLNVFKKLNYDILWKYEADDLPSLPENVMTSKWLPQADLLAHPKMKIFITQAGQQSIDEAIDRCVPMIVMPFNFDQPVHAEFVAKNKIGCHLNVDDLSEDELVNAIREVLKNEYKEKILKLREIIYDQPMSSREKAVWWTEYVLRHKNVSHLKYPGRLLSSYQTFGIDIFVFVILLLIVVYWIMKKIMKIFIKALKRSSKLKSD